MSYKLAKRASAEVVEAPISHACPAHGCPNAASVSFDGSRWACYYHAKGEATDWPMLTQWVQENWPRSCNWNHQHKMAHEAEAAAKRRAALPAKRGPVGMSHLPEAPQ